MLSKFVTEFLREKRENVQNGLVWPGSNFLFKLIMRNVDPYEKTCFLFFIFLKKISQIRRKVKKASLHC